MKTVIGLCALVAGCIRLVARIELVEKLDRLVEHLLSQKGYR
jgi:hypothetical protein